MASEDFDREDTQGQDEEIDVCPECDATQIYRSRTEQSDSEYGCNECYASFDEPVSRPKDRAIPAGAGSKTAAALTSMNPDDLRENS